MILKCHFCLYSSISGQDKIICFWTDFCPSPPFPYLGSHVCLAPGKIHGPGGVIWIWTLHSNLKSCPEFSKSHLNTWKIEKNNSFWYMERSSQIRSLQDFTMFRELHYYYHLLLNILKAECRSYSTWWLGYESSTFTKLSSLLLVIWSMGQLDCKWQEFPYWNWIEKWRGVCRLK